MPLKETTSDAKIAYISSRPWSKTENFTQNDHHWQTLPSLITAYSLHLAGMANLYPLLKMYITLPYIMSRRSGPILNLNISRMTPFNWVMSLSQETLVFSRNVYSGLKKG